MSDILSNLIKQELKSEFGSSLEDPDRFAKAIAKAVQQYLVTYVRVAPGILVATTGSPVAHAGATTTPGTLQAQ